MSYGCFKSSSVPMCWHLLSTIFSKNLWFIGHNSFVICLQSYRKTKEKQLKKNNNKQRNWFRNSGEKMQISKRKITNLWFLFQCKHKGRSRSHEGVARSDKKVGETETSKEEK